jgi:predicted nucleic-acid-binding Zn-ribbon protein
MSKRKPKPLFAVRERASCPVCGEAVYSLSGIHPQCAVKRGDEKRVARLKAQKKTAKKVVKKTNSLAIKPWHKRCPKCRNQIHVRKSVCDCGHKFTA